MTLRTLLLIALFLAVPAFAADAGDDTPDASAGNGGSEQNTQESDEDMKNGTCALSRDCERGFQCVSGRCTYVGYRQATQGCSSVPMLTLGAAALIFLSRRLLLRASRNQPRND